MDKNKPNVSKEEFLDIIYNCIISFAKNNNNNNIIIGSFSIDNMRLYHHSFNASDDDYYHCYLMCNLEHFHLFTIYHDFKLKIFTISCSEANIKYFKYKTLPFDTNDFMKNDMPIIVNRVIRNYINLI